MLEDRVALQALPYKSVLFILPFLTDSAYSQPGLLGLSAGFRMIS